MFLEPRASESSSQAVSVFNKAGLLDVVVQCLERHPHNMELAISAGRTAPLVAKVDFIGLFLLFCLSARRH